MQNTARYGIFAALVASVMAGCMTVVYKITKGV